MSRLSFPRKSFFPADFRGKERLLAVYGDPGEEVGALTVVMETATKLTNRRRRGLQAPSLKCQSSPALRKAEGGRETTDISGYQAPISRNKWTLA